MPRLRHYDDLGVARFLTFSCFRHYPHFKSAGMRNLILPELKALRVQHRIRLLAWVLMPDHMHLVILPPEKCDVGGLIGRFKARTVRVVLGQLSQNRRRFRSDGHAALWQRWCYDRNCRPPEEVREEINYCHANPVRAGLVAQPEDWPWSSGRWYAGWPGVLLDIDGVDV